jgi:hypothetical protein
MIAASDIYVALGLCIAYSFTRAFAWFVLLDQGKPDLGDACMLSAVFVAATLLWCVLVLMALRRFLR